MHWYEEVDNWLEENGTEDGIQNLTAAQGCNLFIWKLCLFPIMAPFWIFGKKRDEFFFELIRSKNHKSHNLEDKSAKKRIHNILSAELITLAEEEEVLFLIEDDQAKECGIVFTNSRVVYNLLKPSKLLSTSYESGRLPISAFATKVQVKHRLYLTITVNGEDIGKIGVENYQPINDFLSTVRKALMNENSGN